MNADKMARFLYSIDPRNFSRVDFVFTFSFVCLVLSAVLMFETANMILALSSLVGMFLFFCVMTLCVALEDVFVKEDKKDKEKEKDKRLTRMEDLKKEI